MPRVGRYQGEVMEKAAIQDAYRLKVAAAQQNNGRPVYGQDWADLEKVLISIISANNQPGSEAPSAR
jgi:hypothetical protein